MNKQIKTYNIIFFSLVAAAFLFILFSNPFLRLPYDPWDHLLRIASLYDEGTCFYFWPDNRCPERILWHELWAYVFKFSEINDVFVWAKIIHVFQFSLASLIMFYFSKTALTILTNEKDSIRIKFLSLFSVFLWFIGNGTFPAYQQAWIMWYSVTHQGLTIPLFWYCTALTLKLFYEDLSFKKIPFFIVQIAGASFLMAKIHPSELLYYLIILSTLVLINSVRLIRSKDRKTLLIFIPVIFLMMFVAVKYVMPQKVPLFSLISSGETVSQILQKIKDSGYNIVHGINRLNRFPNSFSEIAIISLIAMAIFRVNYLFTKDKDISFHKNIFDFLLISSTLFFLIPMVPLLAGLGEYLTTEGGYVVYRFFFASPWFIFLPFAIYKVLTMKEIHMPFYKFIITGILILYSVVHFHKYLIPNIVKGNTKSIIASLDKEKVGVQYSKNDIDALRKIIMECEQSSEGKPNMYFTEEKSSVTGGVGDKAYIIRGVFRKYVYGYRRTDLTEGHFYKRGLDKKYNLIDIDHPEEFRPSN